MFALVKGVYGEMTRRDEYFVAVLGLDGAGKTVRFMQKYWLTGIYYR